MKITKFLNGGELHEYGSGTKKWYLSDKLHREDGPAIEYADGDKFWFINDKRHREDGPAIEWGDGDKSWYLNDKFIPCETQKEFERLMKLKAFW
jgi:hypothetical protein